MYQPPISTVLAFAIRAGGRKLPTDRDYEDARVATIAHIQAGCLRLLEILDNELEAKALKQGNNGA